MIRARFSVLFCTFALLLSAPICAQKLKGAVGYNLGQIEEKLDKGERLVKQGDTKSAETYYSSAKLQWDTVNKDFASQIDAKHPHIVSVRTRLETLAAAIGKAGTKQESPEPAGGAGDNGSKAPPAAMLYVLKQIDSLLDSAESLAKADELEGARLALRDAEQKWKTQLDWNKGKFDAEHPQIRQLAERLAAVSKTVSGTADAAADMAGNLQGVLTALQTSQEQLDTAYQAASAGFRDLGSLLSDFDSGREQNVDKLRAQVERVRASAERVQELMPAALTAVAAFRKQYPDTDKLEKLVSGSDAAIRSAKKLERFGEDWQRESKMVLNDALQQAKENIDQYGTSKLARIAGSDADLREIAAANAEQWVLQYSAYLLELVPAVLPELPAEAQAALPELVANRARFTAEAKKLEPEIARVHAAVAKTRKDVADAERMKLEAARFPKTAHTDPTAETAIREAWSEALKDKQLLRLSIYRPFEVRNEARWRRDHWEVDSYRYVGANCLAKLPDGRFMVYRMNFRNTMQADGSWSPLVHWSVGHVFEILEANASQ